MSDSLQNGGEASPCRYWTFISYSQQDDPKDRSLWGDWPHEAVEMFKVAQAANRGEV
jgi:hypothetical protein